MGPLWRREAVCTTLLPSRRRDEEGGCYLVQVLVPQLVLVLSASSKGRVGETKARPGHYPIMRALLIPCSYLKWHNGFTTIVTFILSKLSLVLKDFFKDF